MKEAFWGLLIIILGIFGIVCINLFQNVTVDNDKVYYVLKESTEASAHDSIDLSYYRLGGSLRIVEDKFVENLARRFSQSITAGRYTISVQNINELPPLMSVKIRSGVSSIKGDEFNLTNRVDAIIETKYKLSEVLDFLGITEEEWNDINNKNKDTIKNGVCGVTFINDGDLDCITGDLRFDGLGDTDLKNAVCMGQQKSNVEATAKYSVCECGKWVSKEETLVANPVLVNNDGNREYVYTYRFVKTGEIRNIDETIIKRVRADVCTTGVEVWVPKDLREKEPSSDNSKYVKCDPATGIRIPEDVEIVLHPNYIPLNATNREIKWTAGNASLLSFGSFSVTQPTKLTGFSRALIKGKLSGTEEEQTTMTATTTLDQSAVCPIRVWDGNVDSVSCENINTKVGYTTAFKGSYEPYNATKTKLKLSIDDTSLVELDELTGKAKALKVGTATITVTAENGKTATCTLKVDKYQEPRSDGGYSGAGGGGGAGIWIVTDKDGNRTTYSNMYNAIKAAGTKVGEVSISVSNGSGEYEWAKGVTESHLKSASTELVKTAGGTISIKSDDKNGIIFKIKDENGRLLETNQNPPPPPYQEPCYCCGGCGGGYVPGSPEQGAAANNSIVACFEKGTEVLTNNGYKDISKLKVGEKVLSYNENTKKNEYAKIIKVYKHEKVSDTLFSLTINGTIVKASSEHPFYIKTVNGITQIKAENLKIGDIVITSFGNYYPITFISSMNIVEDLYNIEVENNHNYYVTRENVLVHNKP